jgi:hypothetical protein
VARALLGAVVLSALVAGSVALAGGNTRARMAIVPPPAYPLQKWNADTDNLIRSQGTIELNGTPVAGVRVRVDGYQLPSPTDTQGHFVYLLDQTLLARHVVSVTDATSGKVGGRPLTSAEQSELIGKQASISVAYGVRDLKVSRDGVGHPVVTGRLVNGTGGPPALVGLLTYRLTGTVTDSSGHPVAGAQVSTRTLDRDYWTVSTVTDASGLYSSLFTASDETSENPVPFTVRISKGEVVYQFLSQEVVYFKRLESARMDIRVPPIGFAMALPRPQSFAGAVYTGVVVGATAGGNPVRPVAATWPDRNGRFSLTLPKRTAGQTVSIWEGRVNLFSRHQASPGGAIDLTEWPVTVPRTAPRDLVKVQLK